MLIEVGGLAVSVVTLLLQRLDKRREDIQSSPDLQQALLVLSESLGRWAEAAIRTNANLKHPAVSSRWPRIRRRVWRPLQMRIAGEVTDWLSEEGSGDAASAQAVLATYAPELRDQLRQVAATRNEQLLEIQQFKAAASRERSNDDHELIASAMALDRAKRELDAFIRETFPQPPAG